ncbi:MAG TPA: single-stranded-DNA-specific exonuclease RecJ [Phycisphaerae bacterium]|nr:single-stranded-DNA-specific exonuclease RecJ [Phycisphaerae bacterium]
MAKEWIIQPPWERCEEAAVRWNVPPLVAQLLYNRGIDLDGDPGPFLCPRLKDLHPPELLPGAQTAAALLADAVRAGRRIVLYGDYDVDGITGVAILWRLLTKARADVGYYVPHRLEEGYGLNAEAIRKLAEEGAQIIVSVDCGITAVEVAATMPDGVELIITDHHQPKERIPEAAAAIVHPTVGGDYPNPHLCGAGVAFKLAWALAQELSGAEKVAPEYRDLLMEALPLAALGTIADVVPLVGENRIIARCGLAPLKDTEDVGLRALIESAGLTGQRIGDYEVGFRLAPRLNAAGRMGHARLAVEMLIRPDADRAREIALYLEEHNRSRRSLERRILQQAREMVEQRGMDGDACRGIVLAAEGWHAGVIGIVAARLVDRYRRPTVLIAVNGESGQGSARSVEHFEMHEALTACSEHLLEFGGHSMAAGLRIDPQAVEAFTNAFIEQANNRLTGADLRARLRLDAEVSLGQLDLRTVEAVENLGPFGTGNPKPRLATGWIELAGEPRRVGGNGEHLQAAFRDGDAVMRGIAFGQAAAAQDLMEYRRCRIAFEPTVNEYQGRRSAEIRVLDFQFPDGTGPGSV